MQYVFQKRKKICFTETSEKGKTWKKNQKLASEIVVNYGSKIEHLTIQLN